MGFDDKLFRELEHKNNSDVKKQRKECIRNAEKDRDRAAAKPDNFHGIIPDEIISDDKATVEYLRNLYKDSKPSLTASALEHVINTGIDTGVFFSPTGSKDTIESINTSEFDDKVNRVDTAATIHHIDEKTGEKSDLTFAIDLFSGDPDVKKVEKKALEKIAIATHSKDKRSKIFAGFTEIRYYKDSKGKKQRLWQVPRYCIGVDKKSIEEATDEVFGIGNLFKTGSMSEIRFKMLYEMSKQNELYETYLYKYSDLYEEAADQDIDFTKAIKSMETLDKIYQKELSKAQKALGPDYQKLDIERTARYLMSDDTTFKGIVKATEKLLKNEEENEEELSAYRARHSGKRIAEALKHLTSPNEKVVA